MILKGNYLTGRKHSALYPPGVSGNPGGKRIAGQGKGYAARRILQNIEEQAREHGGAALEFLVSLINNPDAPIKERRLAAEGILDRGYGKPVDRIAVEGLTSRAEANGSDFIEFRMTVVPGTQPPDGVVVEGEYEDQGAT